MVAGDNKPNSKPKVPNDKKKIVGIVVFALGLITLIIGVVFLVIKLVSTPAMQDGEFLTKAKEWVMDGTESVIWDFTEIGKGKLTTNKHLNDYDFQWALEGDKLIIKTDWLYTLDNEYEYKLDQNEGVLMLKNGEKEFKFLMVSEKTQE